MTQQYPLTLVTPVLASMKDTLFEFLQGLKISLDDHMHESFENIGTIHYARWLVIDYEIEKGESEMGDMPKLVFSSNFDCSVHEHIRDLSTTASDIIDSIYACCEGYPGQNERTPESRIAYLSKWILPASAFFQGSPGRSLKQIRDENKLRDFIRNFLDSKNWDKHSAKKVHKEIQEAVFSQPGFSSWVKIPIKLPGVNLLAMIVIGILLIIFSPILIIWILIVQYFYERHDKYFTLMRSQLDEDKIRQLEIYEDFEMQNQFSQLVSMKPGRVRLITFKFMMLFARNLIRYKFVEGKLMGIPTIHFARWVLFDNNKRGFKSSDFISVLH